MKMKEKNKIKLMRIATILRQLYSNGTINGEENVAIVNIKALNNLGEEIEQIIMDELNNKLTK